MPKRSEIAQTWGAEIVVSDRAVQALIDAGITGWGLGPVQRARRGDEEPFTFRQTDSGRRLLEAAALAGIPYPSPRFYVWMNERGQRALFLAAAREHECLRLSGRRLSGGTSSDWFQFFVTSPPVQLSSQTLFGTDSGDEDPVYRHGCPLGLPDHVVGFRLASKAIIQGTSLTDFDFLRSTGFVGRRAGLYNPQPLLFVSLRVRDTLAASKIKGWKSREVDVL